MLNQNEWIPVQADFERVASHEAGHAVVGLSMGVSVEYIEMLQDDGVPAPLKGQGFHAGVAVQFTTTIKSLEPRMQYTIAVGGMAGERLVLGSYNSPAAAFDIDALKAVGRTDGEIEGLTEIAQKILSANFPFFHRLRSSLRQRLSSSDRILLQGAALNVRFKKSGTKVDISADLERLLPD
jgi:hypothetical protein